MEDLLDNGRNQLNAQRPENLPQSTAVLVLGIISIVGCFLYAVPGIVCGIIAIVLHKKDKAMYLSNPEKYEVSFKNSKAGNVCAIIGLSCSAAYLLFFILLLTVGLNASRF